MTKRGMVIVAVIALMGFLGSGGVIAAGRIAENNAIGKEAAQNFAYIDAGILPEDVTWVRTKFDFENGVFVYDVEFIAGGVKYDYNVKAADGMIIAAESERIAGYAGNTGVTDTDVAAAGTGSTAQGAENAAVAGASVAKGNKAAQTSYINVDDAQKAALAHAGISQQSGLTFTKTKLERDDGRVIYDIEFYIGNTEYDYTIDALNGSVLESEVEQKPQPAVTTPTTPTTPAAATVTPQTPSGQGTPSQPSVTQPTTPSGQTTPSTPAVTDPSTPSTPAITPQPSTPSQPNQPSNPPSHYDDDDDDDYDDDDDHDDHDDHHDDHDDDDDDDD